MLTILHVFVDDKFPQNVFGHFVEEGHTKNLCVIFNFDNDKLNYVGSVEGLVELKSRNEVKCFFQANHYDVVFFHSLTPKQWFCFHFIPKDKKVIWWMWGYDVYQLPYGLKPFIKIGLYKTKTKEISKGSLSHRIKLFIEGLQYPLYVSQQRRVLRRVDYFQPVISAEYEMMKKNKFFRAQEFYYPSSMVYDRNSKIEERDPLGDIILGNSSHYSNNHLDCTSFMSVADLKGRTIHIPVSYGVEKYCDYLKKNLKVEGANLDFMEKILPLDEYFAMMSKCTYFISGVIRQQSMGNIIYCMQHGIKVFLFKDSIVYRYLKNAQCYVFAIEDINDGSFKTPLTKEEAEHNKNYVKKETMRRDEIWKLFLTSNNQ